MPSPAADLPLVIADLRAGLGFLARLPADDPEAAERQLQRLLDALLAQPPAAEILFALLEQTRAPLAAAAAEFGRRFPDQPLPLEPAAEAGFGRCLALWRKMAAAYALCLGADTGESGGPQFLMRLATVLQRCLYYVGLAIHEHYRARRELPAGLWRELHGYYRLAEEHGIAYLAVDDPLLPEVPQMRCAAVYLAPLLTEIASPYGHGPRELELIRHWALIAAPLLVIAPPPGDRELPAYVVDLAGDAPLHAAPARPEPGGELRGFDPARLVSRIGQLLTLLRQHVPPAQLGLGEESNGKAGELLEQLRHAWGLEILPRRFRRFPAIGSAEVVGGFEAMYFHVSGDDFEQPDSAATYSRGEFDQLFTFREQSEPGVQPAFRATTAFPPDPWTVVNHSASGFRLLRGAAGADIRHGQLLAVKPHDGDRYLLATVCWLMQEQGGELEAGIAMLPGVPEGVGVRILIPGTPSDERFVRAFRLPALPAIHEEASLVLPSGLYRASRVLEVVHGDWQIRPLRMNHILQRGCDFDRVSYKVL